MSIAAWTDQGVTSLGFVPQMALFEPSRCAMFSREWMCRNCGETRFVEGASLTPPLRQCRWCGKEGSDWVSVEVDFKDKQNSQSCCATSLKKAPVKVPPGTFPRGPHKALLIGINYFNEGSDLALKGSYHDVWAMKQFLHMQGWPIDDEHMKVLLDDRSSTIPTRDAILEALHWLIYKADAGSNLFFHFSGQGVPEESCLMTADSDIVLEDEIWEIIGAGLPRGARLTALFDCVLPMTLLKTPKHYVVEQGKVHSHLFNPSPHPIEFPGDIVTFYAAPTKQPFKEVQDSRQTGAVFHAFMASILEGGADQTYSDLITRMERNFWTRNLQGMTVHIGCLDPREFDVLARLNLTADHTALKPLDKGQVMILMDLLPDLPSEHPDPVEEVAEPEPHVCTSLYCCKVYQQYDALRTPQTCLAMVPSSCC